MDCCKSDSVAALPNTFVSISPSFTIGNDEKVEEACKMFVEKTKSETGVMYYGFVRSGDKLMCREAYADAEAAIKHLENVGEALGACLEEGTLKLEALTIHGPKDQLDIVKPKADALGPTYYENIDGAFTNLKSFSGTEDKPYDFISIHPIFTVSDWSKYDVDSFIEKTKTEEGCLFYGLTKHEDKLIFREAYKDAEAVKEHLAGIGDLLGALLEQGVLKLDSVRLLGPKEEMDKVKEVTDAWGPTYMETMMGFSRFSVRVESDSRAESLLLRWH